jgi:hypothetical protein
LAKQMAGKSGRDLAVGLAIHDSCISMTFVGYFVE